MSKKQPLKAGLHNNKIPRGIYLFSIAMQYEGN